MTILIAAGGTGGHLYPAVALARECLRRDPSTKIVFVGTAKGIETKVLSHEGFIGMYSIGWHYNPEKEPALCNTIKRQQAATNILGLDYKELKPRIAFTPGNNLYGRYVTIATNSTAGCKFWTKEGWQQVINFLHEKGYKVINISKEKNPFDNCEQIEDVSMENTMNVIHHSHLFIGLSSGLTWLAWAMNKKVVMISNFTD